MFLFAVFLFASNVFAQSLFLAMGSSIFLSVIGGAAFGVTLPTWYVSRQIGAGVARDFHLRHPGSGRLVATAAVAVAAIVPTAWLAGLSEQIHPVDEQWLQQFLAELPVSSLETTLAFVAVAVAAPVAEELVFRGILYRLARGLWGPLAAAIVSSLCFGLAHFSPWQFFGLVAVGLVLAFVYETTRSLLACVLAHGLHNSCSLALMLLDRQSRGAHTGIVDLNSLQTLIVSLVVLLVAGVYLAGRRPSWR
jgi:membrane protease YdiL (CAAX protease family)